MGRLKQEFKNEDLGFQIAPMIDVVFVVMLFFMVKVGARQVEMEIKSQLPGNSETVNAVAGLEAMEETIAITDNGEIAHNDEVVAPPVEKPGAGNAKEGLDVLKNRMKALADQGKASHAEPLVTISTHPDTKYFRIVDVLNCLQYAGIKNMTFTTSDDF